MEGDPAQLTPRSALLVLTLTLGLSSLPIAACSSDEPVDAVTTTTSAPAVVADPDEFCARLATLADADPFREIFGNDNPMDAAAAFDNGQHVLDELAAAAPSSIAPAADGYRNAFAGFRDLVLPTDTIDQDSYEAAFDELRAQQQAARAELDRHLAEECSR